METKRIFATFAITLTALSSTPGGSTVGDPELLSAEGVVYSFGADDQFVWQAESGDYYLYIAAEEPTTLRVEGIDSYNKPEMMFQAGQRTGTLITFMGNDSTSLDVLNGTGKLVLGRMTFQTNLPVTRPPDRLEAAPTLSPGECHAYPARTTLMKDPFLVRAAGSELEFAIFESALNTLNGPSDSLEVELDPDDHTAFLVQACNPSTASSVSAAQIAVIYPAPESARESTRAIGALAPMLIVVIVGLLAITQRR